MTPRRLDVAVCGVPDRLDSVAAAIGAALARSADPDRGVDADGAGAVTVRPIAGAADRSMAAEHHLVVQAGLDEPRSAWADLAVAEEDDVAALVDERLLPWQAKWAVGRRAPRAQVAALAEPDPGWAATAARLVARLGHHTAGEAVVRIDHIGSTSVPGLPAKNLIDIQITVTDDSATLPVAEAATGAGFVQVRAELFGKDRRGGLHPEQVCVDADPGRPVNVNIRSAERPVAGDALLFRDWLRAVPEARERYLAMKRGLEGGHVDDYGDAKEPFISAALEEADAWAARSGRPPAGGSL